MTISKETLLRFIDGELPPEEASHVEAQIAADPELRGFVDTQTALRHEFASAFSPVMGEAIPDRLAAAIANTPISWRWRLRQAFSGGGKRNGWIWTGLPAAGALALGLIIGIGVHPSAMGPIATQKNGTMEARGVLADALNTRLASEAQPANAPHIGVSFRSKDGRDCRTFETGGMSGIACRGDAKWDVAALAAAPKEPAGTYHMAGSAMPDAIRAVAAQMIDGAPFDAAAERRARERGWK